MRLLTIPMVLREDVDKYFYFKRSSPFMTYAPKAKPITKTVAPAIVHDDETSRVQTISKYENPILYSVLNTLKKRGRPPIIMNSSFNIAGEPIVDTPEEAQRSFGKSDADVLYINGKRIVNK